MTTTITDLQHDLQHARAQVTAARAERDQLAEELRAVRHDLLAARTERDTARDQARDADHRLTQFALSITELVHTTIPRAQRTRPSGTCKACDTSYQLRADGTLPIHGGTRRTPCPGSQHPPRNPEEVPGG